MGYLDIEQESNKIRLEGLEVAARLDREYKRMEYNYELEFRRNIMFHIVIIFAILSVLILILRFMKIYL